MSSDTQPAPAPARSGKIVGLLIFVVVAVLLIASNPSEEAMNRHIAQKGWAPLRLTHTNLLLLRIASLEGLTGAQGLYLGVAGQFLELSSGK